MEQLSTPDFVKDQATMFVKLKSLLQYHSKVLDDFHVIISPSLTNRVNNSMISDILLRNKAITSAGIFQI